MNEFEFSIENDIFELRDIFECGQCFRWNKIAENQYIGVIDEIVVKVEKNNNQINFKGVNYGEKEPKELIYKYFDLERTYKNIQESLQKVDENMRIAIEYGKGIRILNQDLWETIISFIISANNNIPRIKKTIEKLSEKYGKEMFFEGKKYYSFPKYWMLKNVSVEEFRELGLGFRDVRVKETVEIFEKNQEKIKELYNLNTEELFEELLKFSGVGPKVANCIILFSDLKRFDVFPIDVWVRRVMNDLYFKKLDEKKLKDNEIQEFADEKYGDLKGLAQQYLFYYRREN